MGARVSAASPGSVPAPSLGVPPPPPLGTQSPTSPTGSPLPPEPLPEPGPGTFEDLHKKCKDVFPMPFEGAKLLINKGLSQHFQISHTMTMSTLQPSGYKFGATYVGTKQFGPAEAYPVLLGELDPSGNLNANIIHQFSKSLRCKFVSQIQGGKWLATQLTTDWRGEDFTASMTLGNPDLINGSGVIVGQYLQNVTKRFDLGAELLYQYGGSVPGGQIGIYTIAGRYSGDTWQASANITPMAGGLHTCYYQKAGDSLQIGVELEGSLRTQECTATVGYQIELANANLAFKGQVDSNWCVGATMEKKLPPLPFTFSLSAFANHVKGTYRFGVGLIVG
ncbi:hypothetical protein LSH36_287g03034 [Paralvinella palmiformis]|uniref:Uncharacterized protein n=1 Tax=Paralvinella palmiformis TaxID=53620 RepID=A0AAD9JJB8_9ANNE|nr:hypothetical protein LSH36_287g03034 [Paralvinella palmiformis]